MSNIQIAAPHSDTAIANVLAAQTPNGNVGKRPIIAPDSASGQKRVSILMREVPDFTGRGLSTAYRDAKLGKLKTRKSGRSTIILMGDLMAWLGAEPSNS